MQSAENLINPGRLQDIITPNTKKLKEQIDEMAFKLAYNYVTNSFGDTDVVMLDKIFNVFFSDKQNSDSFKTSFKEYIESNKRVRNIMIVGAGASKAAISSIPLGLQLKENAENKYFAEVQENGPEFMKRKLNTEMRNLKAMIGEKSITFENYLHLLTKSLVTQPDLRKYIRDITGVRYTPSLFNGIVAHMLKHGFLDVVINYNFEETLDQEIEDEIGKENYFEIISDGHCVKLEDITRDGRLTTPLYIKPHGSNSHKSTLRFTNNHYIEMPYDIKEMLECLLKGKKNTTDETELKTPQNNSLDVVNEVNLFVVGFALESFELNEILKECFANSSDIGFNIFHIDRTPLPSWCDEPKFNNFLSNVGLKNVTDLKQTKFDLKSTNENCNNKIEFTGVCTDFKNTSPVLSSLDELFSVIWKNTHDKFDKKFWPRSLGKHEILYYLMFDEVLREKPETSFDKVKDQYETFGTAATTEYFLDKTLIEVAFSFIRNKGIVDLIELLKGKAGKYHDLYLKSLNKFNKSKTPYSIYQLVSYFTLSDSEGLKANTDRVDFLKYSDNHYKVRHSVVKDFSALLSGKKSQPGDAFLNSLYKNSLNLISGLKPESDYSTKLAIYITCKLFESEYLSDRTKNHISKSYSCKINNGYRIMEGAIEVPENNLLQEILRLFNKSAGSHYYVIKTREKDPVHNMLETFTCENLLHTNLSYDYRCYELLHKGWDLSFIVAEKGAILKLAPSLKENQDIIMICCYEALESMTQNGKPFEEYEILKENILQNTGISANRVTLLLLPSREHNHHVSLFFKKEESVQSDSGKTADHSENVLDTGNFPYYFFDALYHFRSGFSNAIDPVLIKHKNNPDDNKTFYDYGKLIKLFHLLTLRSLAFMHNTYKEDSVAFKVLEGYLLKSKVKNYYEYLKNNKNDSFNSFKKWEGDKYDEEVKIFLRSLE